MAMGFAQESRSGGESDVQRESLDKKLVIHGSRPDALFVKWPLRLSGNLRCQIRLCDLLDKRANSKVPDVLRTPRRELQECFRY